MDDYFRWVERKLTMAKNKPAPVPVFDDGLKLSEYKVEEHRLSDTAVQRVLKIFGRR